MKEIISDFLSYLRVPVSKSYCEQLIATHPEYPSVLSISDSLARLGVPCIVGVVAKDKLADIEFPYILQLGATKYDSTILTVKNANDLEKNKDILHKWHGTVIKIEPTSVIIDEIAREEYARSRFLRIASIITLIAALVPVGYLLIDMAPVSIVALLTSLAGISIGYTLFAKELGLNTDIGEAFCGRGSKTACDKILSSDGAKLFGDVKLTDLVVTYFIFQFIVLLATRDLNLLQWFSVLAIPFVLFSVYYQAFVAKVWCKLCLTVNAILVTQLALFYFIELPPRDNTAILIQGLSFIGLGGLIQLAKHAVIQFNKTREALEPAVRIKNNPAAFSMILQQQTTYNTKFMDVEIVGGSRNAPVQIVMVGNLYCGPCKKQHVFVDQLVRMYPERVAVAFRLSPVPSADPEVTASVQYVIQYWLQNIYGRENESENTMKMMADWYKDVDIRKFKKSHLVTGPNIPKGEEMETRYSRWMDHMKIDRTPAFFLNGYEFPDQYYEIKDLISIVPLINEQVSEEATLIDQ